jgi:hypothetical protein
MINTGAQTKDYSKLYKQREEINKIIEKIKLMQGELKTQRIKLRGAIRKLENKLELPFTNFGDTLHILNLDKIKEQLDTIKKLEKKIIWYDDYPLNFEYREMDLKLHEEINKEIVKNSKTVGKLF